MRNGLVIPAGWLIAAKATTHNLYIYIYNWAHQYKMGIDQIWTYSGFE